MILLNHSSCQHPQMTSLANCISYQLILPLSKPPSGKPGFATMRCLFFREWVFNHSFYTIVLLTVHKEVLLINQSLTDSEVKYQPNLSSLPSLETLDGIFPLQLQTVFIYYKLSSFNLYDFFIFGMSGKTHRKILPETVILLVLLRAAINTYGKAIGLYGWFLCDADLSRKSLDGKRTCRLILQERKWSKRQSRRAWK